MTFTYDADRRRVEKETPSETTKSVYDLKKILQETDGTGGVEQQYTFTDKEYGDLISEFDGTDTSYHHYDAVGTTDALLDEDETATDRYQHRAFGIEESHTGTSDSPFTFVGQQSYHRDPELDLYLAGNRYYDPQAGRWVSQDPIGFEAGDANLYRYLSNNPVNKVDPSGLETSDEQKVHFNPDYIPTDRIDRMVELGLAQRFRFSTWFGSSREFVYIVDVVGDKILHTVLELRTVHHRRSRATDYSEIKKRFYRIIKNETWPVPDYPGARTPESIVHNFRQRERARKYVEDFREMARRRSIERVFNAADIGARMVPLVNTAIELDEGNYGEAALSFAGDVSLLVGVGLYVKGAQAARQARKVMIVSTAVDGAVASVRTAQGIFELRDGETGDALGHFGEATLMLLGLGAQAKQLRRLGKAASATQADEAAKNAQLARNAIDRANDKAATMAKAEGPDVPTVPSNDTPRVGDPPYNPHSVREALEERHPGQVTSTTVPPVNPRNNVHLAGTRHHTGIVFDQRGFPIFDDVARVDLHISSAQVAGRNYRSQMRAATRALRAELESGAIPASRFTPEQLRAIRGGRNKIPGFTWHHHQDIGRMQLVPEGIHADVGHIGGFEMWYGR
ncbi:MAG: HNH endonuclease [Candidatus Paceibacterota bacterium]